MIKYIASDLDGTLLQNGALELSPRIFDLILKLKQNGIHFISASGRQYSNQRLLFSPVKDEISYIAENGSLCMHNHEVIARGLIERSLGLRIIDAIHELPGCHCLLSCESRCYTDSADPQFIWHMQNILKYDMAVVKNLHDIKEPFLKIAVCDFKGTKNISDFFSKRFQSEIKVATSGNIWVDFIAPNANKGTGLTALLDHLGISPKDGIAFGDQYNDVEMLQLAGISYAMETAAPGISKYADHTTPSVENVLEELLQTI